MKACLDIRIYLFRQLGKSLVETVLFYAAGLWVYEEFNGCNSVQKHALRCFLCLHKDAAKAAIEGHAGWEPHLIK